MSDHGDFEVSTRTGQFSDENVALAFGDPGRWRAFVSSCPANRMMGVALALAESELESNRLASLEIMAHAYSTEGPFAEGAALAGVGIRITRDLVAMYGAGPSGCYVMAASRLAQTRATCLMQSNQCTDGVLTPPMYTA